jgi:hypothetical protein
VHFKLAILTVLATRPDGRATLDELKGEVEALTVDEDRLGDISSDLDDIDIFQSGLVIPDDGGLRITDTGRSALKALSGPRETSLDLPPTSASQSLKMIDDLIGTEGRLKIFDLALRRGEAKPTPGGAKIEDDYSMDAMPGTRETGIDLPPENIAQPALYEASDTDPQGSERIAVLAAEPRPTGAPTILVHDGRDSPVHAPGREAPRRPRFSSQIAAKLRQAAAIWRRHLEQDKPNIKAGPRRSGNVSGAAIALLSFLVLVICAGAVVALTQIRALKSEVANLQRELSPLRERAAKAELLEKAKQNADQQREAQNKPGAEKNKAGAEPRTEQAALNLTPEEIRQIRDFIKPAPAAGTPSSAINVGDTVSVATIPLPSQLMEKIPKLLGARFTTRNGSIIIVRRDSRQADAVLAPN